MKKSRIKTAFVGLIALSFFAFAPVEGKLTSTKTHIQFYSTTAVEDITAHNYKTVSTIDPSSGSIVFSVPMQSFEFEIALMQKHFNSSKFLNTKKFPKAKLVATITNLSDVKFDKNGTYSANIKGTLDMHGKTNPISEKATITIMDKSVKLNSKFYVTLADYDIAFTEGKPSTNIAKKVEITVDTEYK